MLPRQCEDEVCAETRSGADADTPVMHLDEVLDDGEAESSAAERTAARFVHAIEAFEEMWQMFSGNADTEVCHSDAHAIGFRDRRDLYAV